MSQTLQVKLPVDTLYVSGTVNKVSVIWTNVGGQTWEAIADRADNEIYYVELTVINSLGIHSYFSLVLYYGLKNLITDRVKADVDRVKKLSGKRLSGMSDSEKEEYLAGMKGAYNAFDLNRVGAAVNYLAERLVNYGYIVSVDPKIDWMMGDLPTPTEMEHYLDQVRIIKNSIVNLPTTPALPLDMQGLTYEEANAIEQILIDVDKVITLSELTHCYSGEIYAGEENA